MTTLAFLPSPQTNDITNNVMWQSDDKKPPKTLLIMYLAAHAAGKPPGPTNLFSYDEEDNNQTDCSINQQCLLCRNNPATQVIALLAAWHGLGAYVSGVVLFTEGIYIYMANDY
jgi:hypothetical protein